MPSLVASSRGLRAARRHIRSITGKEKVAVTVVNLAEVFDVLDRWYGVTEAEMRMTLDPLIGDPISVVAPTPWLRAVSGRCGRGTIVSGP